MSGRASPTDDAPKPAVTHDGADEVGAFSLRRLARAWPRAIATVWLALALVLGGLYAVVSLRSADSTRGAAPVGECAAGFEPVESAIAEVRKEMGTEEDFAELREGEAGEEELERELVREAVAELPTALVGLHETVSELPGPVGRRLEPCAQRSRAVGELD